MVFVFAHILQHFCGGGIGLRQICDWCRLLYCYREELDVRLLETRLQKAGVMTEWRAFAALAVEWLGMPVEAMPLYDPSPKWKRKAARIVDYIIATGNFGHNREHAAGTGLARKMDSLKWYICDAMRQLAVFLLDAVKVWCRMVSSGIANIKDQVMQTIEIISRLEEFMEQDARSCSMDFGCVTPEYVYRIWGGI